MKRFEDAVALAAIKHAGQRRRDGSAYIYHPLKVAEIVRLAGFNERYQMVAVLHDVIEDTDVTEEDILEFGEDILEAVKLLSRKEGQDEIDYIEKILNNHMAAIVKSADKINNMMDSSFCGNLKFAKKYLEKSRVYLNRFSKAVDASILQAEKNLIKLESGQAVENAADIFDLTLYSEA